MPSTRPWFPFYADDWLTSERVRVMSLAARGAYIDLLAYSWHHGSIPSAMAEVCRLLGIEETALVPLWAEIESCWKKKGSRLVNDRQERERKVADEKAKQQSD